VSRDVAEQIDFAWDGSRLVEQAVRDGTGTRVTTWDYSHDSYTPIGQIDAHGGKDDNDRRF
jgi:hypothetical protein